MALETLAIYENATSWATFAVSHPSCRKACAGYGPSADRRGTRRWPGRRARAGCRQADEAAVSAEQGVAAYAAKRAEAHGLIIRLLTGDALAFSAADHRAGRHRGDAHPNRARAGRNARVAARRMRAGLPHRRRCRRSASPRSQRRPRCTRRGSTAGDRNAVFAKTIKVELDRLAKLSFNLIERISQATQQPGT